ncbi:MULTISPECIES: PAS domain-containing sensor histidine kinase [unclassified Arthrobacter]|nr:MULTISPECIES: PAS domain-containing sensor histidine kinase [unclassified Arthrobacter]MCC9144379.1 PAS domain-containing sensor histidine kinase [Arthrobacter sp. zg-Y919]MDK1275605.1 PAS domain-containing sensor histidine kinase [Arthrobacter sp. zg.Y919]MDM7991238.1 PAS domain-containing sensor histidine kinase [Arthrobacter sp. zg-Y877]WIB03026.1 PAS domain-containing sensor histidine kinase [Arthrobacter sp. zg-Y919]
MPPHSRRFPRIPWQRTSIPDLSTLFHLAPSGHVLISPQGVILETNSTFAAWAGRDRRALEGTLFVDLLSPEDLLEYQRWSAALTSGPAVNLSVDFQGPGNTRLPAYISAARIPSRTGTLDLVTVFPVPGRRRYERDLVEALQQAEAAEAARGAAEQRALQRESLLQTILDTVDVGVLVVDDEGREILANAMMENARSLIPSDGSPTFGGGTWPIYGRDRKTLIPDEQRPISRAIAGESFSEQIVWIGTGQGQMAVSVSARTVRDGSGFRGSVLAFSDVTQLVRALAAQAEFVGNVSHELRTPLTSILGYLDMALEAEVQLPNTVESALQTAVRNAERLLQLVTDLLSVASGSAALDLQETGLAPLVHAAVDSFGARASVNGVEFSVEVPADLRAVVDSGRIREVLENLVSNAVKYSPDGGTVRVRARRQDDSVVIEVADPGIGMTVEEQEQVFTRFFRSGGALTAAIPGAGLGLVITRRIVEEHGGSIGFSSEAGQGTVFTVELPADGPERGLQTY